MIWSTLVAPLVVLAIAAFARAALSGFRTPVSYEVTVIAADIPELRGGKYDNRVTAERIRLRNRGFRHLTDLRLTVTVQAPLWVSQVAYTSSVDETDISLLYEERLLRIHIPALPRGEVVTIILFYGGWSNPEDGRVRGGSNSYRVVRELALINERVNWLTATALLVLGALGLGLIIAGG